MKAKSVTVSVPLQILGKNFSTDVKKECDQVLIIGILVIGYELEISADL